MEAHQAHPFYPPVTEAPSFLLFKLAISIQADSSLGTRVPTVATTLILSSYRGYWEGH